MFASLLTAILFAASAIYGQKTAACYGSIPGNFYRLCLAAIFLGVITFGVYHQSIAFATFSWFFFSGLIGFGIGDVALYLAYSRIGSRLTILITFCLAPLWGAGVEFLWLHTTISADEAIAAGMVLLGVGLALVPNNPPELTVRSRFRSGVAFGVAAGFGQGVGAVISRHAESIANTNFLDINGISAAFQRVLGGIVVSAIAFLLLRQRRRGASTRPPAKSASVVQKTHWLLGATLMGPVIGVSCFQWALKDTPSALVLAIIATSPILIMPMAWFFEDDRPTFLGILGAIIAVAGVVWICFIRV
ncbi:MAG: DMT family transporter [Verrucomicrobiota bacterium]